MNNRSRWLLAGIALVGGSVACAGKAESAAAGIAGAADNANSAGNASNTSNAGNAGNASSAGNNGSSAGSGDAGQLPAQGAVTLTLRGADVHGADCPTPGLTYEVGAPKAPSASDPGMSVVNGEAGAVVSCYVHGMGPFNFSGMLRATAQGSQHDPISVVFDAGEIGSDYRGTATVTVFTPQLGAAFASSQPCTITVINQQVKNGAIWATFSCPQVSSPPSGLCAASGTIVFENCNGT